MTSRNLLTLSLWTPLTRLSPLATAFPTLASSLWHTLPGLSVTPQETRISLRVRLPLGLPDFGIVLAVPKKKTSLTKRRKRRYLPTDKHVKPVQSLTECPSCGRVKRAHTVCGPCHDEIRQVWQSEHTPKQDKPDVPESIDSQFLEALTKKPTSVPTKGDWLRGIRKEENNTSKIPMFEWKLLHDKKNTN
ncbi:hypothetical protein V1512DRAFT_257755 [Lipomyces arxii]|uniref:mitochondrial 54S ribosomal protein bL32m n=1 Tax=Lipomyces arxii TaxID=56418 RepID=UPI0034CD25FB